MSILDDRDVLIRLLYLRIARLQEEVQALKRTPQPAVSSSYVVVEASGGHKIRRRIRTVDHLSKPDRAYGAES